MKGDDFWSCEIGADTETGKYKLDYSGADATITVKHGDKTYLVLIPSEIMDRIVDTWQKWRTVDNPNQQPESGK